MTGGILAVRQDSLGDVLLAGPAIRALAAADKGPVTLLCGPRGQAAGRLLPGVDAVLTHLAEWIDPRPPSVTRESCTRLIEEINSRAPTEAVIFTSFHQNPLPTALLLRLAGVERIAAISHDYPGSLLDIRHRPPDDIHEVERALSLVDAAGYALPTDDDGRLRVNIPAHGRNGLPQEPFVVVHPGASVSARAWERESWRRLVEALTRHGWPVVITGTRDERALTAYVAGADRDVLDLGGKLSFGELAVVLKAATVVAVANTGPAHLAAAVGTPVASLFAPTVPAVRWRPWGVPHILINRSVPCAGCRAVDCPVPGHPCLAEVKVERVLDAVEQLACTACPPNTLPMRSRVAA